MKIALLGFASLICVSMVLQAEHLPADAANISRMKAERDMLMKQRDQANAKLASLEEKIAVESSAAEVRAAESKTRSIAQDQKAPAQAAAAA